MRIQYQYETVEKNIGALRGTEVTVKVNIQTYTSEDNPWLSIY